MFDVSPSLIRYWESEFSSLRPHKNSKGDRRFTKQNIEQLNVIYHLVKEKGFTLEGAQREIKSHKQQLKKKADLLEKLEKLKASLYSLRDRF